MNKNRKEWNRNTHVPEYRWEYRCVWTHGSRGDVELCWVQQLERSSYFPTIVPKWPNSLFSPSRTPHESEVYFRWRNRDGGGSCTPSPCRGELYNCSGNFLNLAVKWKCHHVPFSRLVEAFTQGDLQRLSWKPLGPGVHDITTLINKYNAITKHIRRTF